jgi:hypothetical protein
MSPIITGASISIRKTTIAIITIKAIIPIIIVPIDAHPKSITDSMLLLLLIGYS